MKNKALNKIFIICPILLAVASFAIVFLIIPSINSIKENSAKLALMKGEILMSGEETKELESFKNDYENYKPNLEKIDALLVNSKSPVEFIRFLEETSSQSKISSQISMPAGGAVSAPDSSLPFIIVQISAKGEPKEILNFTEALENGKYLISLENIEIKKSGALLTLKAFSK